VNRHTRTITLRSLMSSPDGLGTVAGRRMQPALIGKVGASGKAELAFISLSGVRQMDVTFARETIVAMVSHHLRRHGICLTNATSEDVLENIAAAADRAQVPLVRWRGEIPQVLGPQPVAGLASALASAMAQPRVRTAQLAQVLDISVTNASTRLKRLWEGGYLMRDEVASATGGAEFVYTRIG